jgi:phosphoenolpyruvate carboxylase
MLDTSGSAEVFGWVVRSIDQLRAIPWIFAWTQTRFHLPVWLGIGDAFQVGTTP